MPVVINIQCEGDLKPLLVLAALKMKKLRFVVAALSVMTRSDVGHVARILEGGAFDQLIFLLKKAHIPGSLHVDFWNAINIALKGGDFPTGNS